MNEFMAVLMAACPPHSWSHAPTVGYFHCSRCRERVEWSDPRYAALLEEQQNRTRQPASDHVTQEVLDEIDELVRPLHWEAWKAGVFTSQDEWPDDEEQEDIVRGIDSVAVREHYEAWGQEIVAKLAAHRRAALAAAIPVVRREVLEEAARYLEGYAGGHYMAQSCAAAIRAMIEKDA